MLEINNGPCCENKEKLGLGLGLWLGVSMKTKKQELCWGVGWLLTLHKVLGWLVGELSLVNYYYGV